MVKERIEAELGRLEDYVLRRVKGIPNDKRLWVLTCMDERLRIQEALGIGPDDAHIFRNAGGIVTDDAIRSAALTTNFFGTREIIVVTHTDCGMLRFLGEEVAEYFRSRGVRPEKLSSPPLLLELTLTGEDAFRRWWKFFRDLGAMTPDDVALKNVEILRDHPLIPRDVRISAYVYEVETHRLRKPHSKLREMATTTVRGKAYAGQEHHPKPIRSGRHRLPPAFLEHGLRHRFLPAKSQRSRRGHSPQWGSRGRHTSRPRRMR